MNPSATGWIQKHFTYLLKHQETYNLNEEELYNALRKQGFIYGSSVKTLSDEESAQLKWTEEEKTKVNLFDALVLTYFLTIENASHKDCIKAILSFYNYLEPNRNGYISSKINEQQLLLEKYIDQRVQTNEPLLKKNFSHIITNALLYIDVLAFDHYLLTDENPLEYARSFESIVIQVVWKALSRKQEKDNYDELLIKLLESSVRYNDWPIKEEKDLFVLLNSIDQTLEKNYLLDCVSLAIGNDQQIDKLELIFMDQFCQSLAITPSEKKESLYYIREFIKENKDHISYLQYSNPIQHFYNHTSNTVRTLILRNKVRLIQEIKQSKELAVLLSQSTVRNLSREEKKLVRNQLIDICKTVPSLAIFLLPGGTILIPLLIKFIPQLLPSAFNENKL